MITMVLGGLWHGASWTMVGWGGIHGLIMVIERLAGHRINRLPAVVRWLITWHVVTVAWVLFRADSFGIATTYLERLFTAPFTGTFDYLASFVILASLGAQLVRPELGGELRRALRRTGPVLQGGLAGAWIWLVVSLGPAGVAPFIYFQF